jgi:hypothetical protein
MLTITTQDIIQMTVHPKVIDSYSKTGKDSQAFVMKHLMTFTPY